MKHIDHHATTKVGHVYRFLELRKKERKVKERKWILRYHNIQDATKFIT